MGTGDSGNYYTSGGSAVVHHPALIHSIDGEYTHDPETGRPQRLKAGGHGQASMELMDKNDIDYNVVKTYENDVRVGNVPNHKMSFKKKGTMQSWFPASWTTRDIVKAGEHAASLKSNQNIADGATMWGTYKGVRVGAIKTNGRIATIFPDVDQSSALKKRRKQ